MEEVSGGSQEGDEDAQSKVDLHAGGAADDRDEEVERVEEQGEEGGNEEEVIPSGDELGARVEDLAPPGDLAVKGEGLGEAVEARGGSVKGVDAMHFPWRKRESESCREREMENLRGV